MSWRALDNPLLWRTAAAVSVGKFCSSGAEQRRSDPVVDADRSPSSPSKLQFNVESMVSCLQLSLALLSSNNITRLEAPVPAPTASATTTTTSPANATTSTTNKQRYDYVILGNGTAGRSALETLRSKCPGASIALIDPWRKPAARTIQRGGGVDYFQHAAISLDPRQRRIGLSNDNQYLQYKYGVLIATGSHGAPPPSYLIDDQARARVWELRPTVLGDSKCLPPTTLRSKVLTWAKQGQVMGILGSSWDALDLAIAAAAVSPRQVHPTLFFGGSGPLSQSFPNYLSSAIAKRLKQKRIHIHDRTLIRYINHNEDNDGLQIYSARSFDFLDSTRTAVDQLVVAPDTMGPRGNAVLPTMNIPSHLVESRDGRFWYESWSQLSMLSPADPSMIICYKDDGRIAVNSELVAASGVYAAGSVAKCGNALTGHADVAGQGVHDASRAGQVAALNMARHYKQDSLFGLASHNNEPLSAAVRPAIPVWRSDILSYDDGQRTLLQSIGIHALCVGTCDAERYATHGVWWTNQAAQQRILRRVLEQDEPTYGASNEMTTQQNKRRRQRLRETTKMVYGLGVVYYLDRTGRIQGVMTWGLPFAGGDEINPRLLERIQQVVLSNGGMNSLESEMDHMRMSKFLATESRALVALAFSESDAPPTNASHHHHLDSGCDGADFPRPLHRYTDIKPMAVRSHGVLKRKDGHGQGILGEDLFSRYSVVVPDPPPSKPLTGGVGYAATDCTQQGQTSSYQAAWNWHEYQMFEQRELRWTENENLARPPKEDALWIRKGDENRNVSAADTRAAVMDSVVGVKRAHR